MESSRTAGQLLQPGENIQVGSVDLQVVTELVLRLYNRKISTVKQLNSYDDKTFLITVEEGGKFVFKISNSLDTAIPDLIDGQNAIMLHLGSKGIMCPTPVLNVAGGYWSLENISEVEHAVRLLNYIEGDLLTDTDSSPRLIAEIGEFLAKVHFALKDFSHPGINSDRRGLWSLESVPKILDFTRSIGDRKREELVTAVVTRFKNVLAQMPQFSQGVIHSDFNEQNILTTTGPNGQVDVAGILDFGDCHFSCLVFDVAVAIMYAMLDSKGKVPIVDIGGYLLLGYLRGGGEVSPAEWNSLKTCICGRYAQSLTIGLYTYNQNPTPENSYVLITQKNGWAQLREFWDAEEDLVYRRWREIIAQKAG